MADGIPKSFVPDASASTGVPKSFVPDASTTSSTTATPAPTASQKQPLPGYEFGKSVGRGMGFDVEKAERMETDPEGGKTAWKGGLELGKQFLQGTGKWMEATAKDPLHFADPIVGAGDNLASAFKKLWEHPSVASGGEVLGGLANVGAMAGKGGGGMPEEVVHASKLLERQIALNKGRVGLVNSAKQAGSLLEHAVTGETGEVGKHAQAVIQADKLDLARTQSEGKVATTPATLAAQAVMDKTKIGGVAGGYPASMPLDAAKALMTQIGREAARLERGGKSPEAAARWAEYDALRKATQDRAAELGPEHAKSWQHYSSEFYKFIQLKKGLFGNLMEDADHVGILKKLTSGDSAAQIPEIKQWFKKYRIDPQPIEYAVEQGQKLDELNQQSKNMFMGKLRAIVKHPLAAGSVAAGAAVAGHASGVPGAGFVLPLILAGKVAGILDAAETAKLLRDIGKKVGAANERVTPEPAGPQPLPPPPGTTGSRSGPTAAADVSAAQKAGRATSQRDILRVRRQTPGESPTGEERRQAPRRAGEEDEMERLRRTGTGTLEQPLAERLKAARQQKRSVYKGKR